MKRIHLRPIRGGMLRAVPAWLALIALSACGGGGGGGHRGPDVTFNASPSSIVLGQSTTLTWTASAGSTCTAGGGWSGAQADTGSSTVTPNSSGSATYTLTCDGGGFKGSTTSTVTVAVATPSAFSETSLVADTAAAGALTTDPNLVNAWGIAFGPTSPAWVANNHTDTSTVYDGNGKPQPLATPLVVSLPAGAGGASFDATGIVFNGSSDFVVSAGGNSGAARFIFDGEGGMIAGWSPTVDVGHAVIMYTDAGGAVYKGLAIGSDGTANYLYAADFHNGKIDVFDASYAKQAPTATKFAFTDPTLPAGYAPFGIQAIANGPGGATQIYVSYAQQAAPDNLDEVGGAGLGLVNVFDASGVLVKHLVTTGGRLNAPWGMALAPANAGTLSNALLVGNFGDGTINGFDPATGAYIGTVSDSAGHPFAEPGLWGIAFGNGHANQPTNTLFYAAGTNDEVNGELGRIDLGATPPVLNAPPVVAITTPSGNVSGTVDVTATATADVNVAKVEFFLNGTTSLGTVTTSPYTVQWDTTTLPNGSVTLTATATDVDGNVGTSPDTTVTIANGAAASKLSDLQTQIFTPKCSACHDGSNAPGGALPGSMDLRAGHSYASLVNVASQEQPALMRVKPGDPGNSYIVHKLEGTAGISGQRMPLGGPYLDQATIDTVRSWISDGAQDN